MSSRTTSSFLVLAALAAALAACRREDESSPESKASPAPSARAKETTPAPPTPELLYLPDGYDPTRPTQPAAPARRVCPAEMVSVGGAFCIDRFEVSLVDGASLRELSPHYPPSRRSVISLQERFARIPVREPAWGQLIPLPAPPSFQLNEDFTPRAVSREAAIPSGYLSRLTARAACENAGKRLCSRDEWVRACRGEANRDHPYGADYQAGACNVHRHSHPARLLHGDASKNHLDPRLGLAMDDEGPLLRRTGATARCRSDWGDDAAFDMVGNLDEWIEDPEGTFLGGFYSRATTAGCSAAIELHGPDYLDYSLGTRCCRQVDP
ncbi:MAG TPA: hypothetical protein VLC09_20330 [Polyangiaceae bacterium]|nr:hypothetical protein [Polyangiaceae bacterium]